ncbi:MAG: hypothetical protein O3B13_07320 [Planctomycetota bacterium]|nr:hypothetical protein [Planctomycetota bacterium]MDA1162894.1 hypothetical protein [Planctomycetota bacterium]
MLAKEVMAPTGKLVANWMLPRRNIDIALLRMLTLPGGNKNIVTCVSEVSYSHYPVEDSGFLALTLRSGIQSALHPFITNARR